MLGENEYLSISVSFFINYVLSEDVTFGHSFPVLWFGFGILEAVKTDDFFLDADDTC